MDYKRLKAQGLLYLPPDLSSKNLNSVHKRSAECRVKVDYQIYHDKFSFLITQIKL